VYEVADVNADGRADLAAANGNGVRVRLGQADATFGAAATFSISSDPDSVPVPSGIAIGDLDGDGDVDLAVAIGQRDDGGSFLVPGTTVSVLPGNGDGTFGASTEFAANRAPRHVAAADINEDGHLDVVVANNPGTAARKTLSVLPGNGDATLSEPLALPLFDFRQDFGVAAMVVADLNRDGHRDVAVVRSGGGSGTPRGEVLFGNGDGTFGPVRPFWMPEFGLAAGDFDGDGLGDLVTGALWIRMQKGVPYQFSDDIYDPQDTSRQSHLGNGLFGLPENHLPSSLFTQRGPIAVADFDRDGRDDIAAIAEQAPLEDVLTVLLNRTPPPAVKLVSLTLDADTVVGDTTSGGTVTLDAPAPAGGTVVELNSTSTCGVQFHGIVGCDDNPEPLTVPAGQTSADFTFVAASPSINFGPTQVTRTIVAQLGGVTRAAPITATNPDHHGTVASWTYTCTGLTCQFDGSGSTSTGTIVSYEWFFGQFEGSASGQTVSHTFSTPGPHEVGLTVTDKKGNWNRKGGAVTPLTAVITVSCTDLACEFDGLESLGSRPIASYGWDFGDGTTRTGAIVRHTYAEPGTYRVTLTVTDDGGATDPQTRDVTVPPGDGGGGLTLSGSSVSNGKTWTAVVTATGSEGASTSGTWDHGGSSGGCQIPAGATTCFFALSGIPKKVSSVTYSDSTDPDLTVTISKP
jgi:PKD repeat protein